MSAPKVPLGVGEYVKELRAYHLRLQEADRARKEVGPRPEMFTPEQSLMLDGLRWRAEQQKRRP